MNDARHDQAVALLTGMNDRVTLTVYRENVVPPENMDSSNITNTINNAQPPIRTITSVSQSPAHVPLTVGQSPVHTVVSVGQSPAQSPARNPVTLSTATQQAPKPTYVPQTVTTQHTVTTTEPHQPSYVDKFKAIGNSEPAKPPDSAVKSPVMPLNHSESSSSASKLKSSPYPVEVYTKFQLYVIK